MRIAVCVLCTVCLLLLAGCREDPWKSDGVTVLTSSDVTRMTETEGSDKTVYYVEGGSVWHTRPDCSALKNVDNIIEDTEQGAFLHGKARVCSKCASGTFDN